MEWRLCASAYLRTQGTIAKMTVADIAVHMPNVFWDIAFAKKLTMETGRHAKETCVTRIRAKTAALVFQRTPLMTASACWDGLVLIVKLGNTASQTLVKMEEPASQKRMDTDAPV